MAHIHELIDFTVTPIIIHPDKDKVLLVFHPRYGKWLCVGGHIELDESPDEALLREIKEECGLEVEVIAEKPPINSVSEISLWRPRFVNIHDANAPHRHVGLMYVCLAKSADFRLSDEHEDMHWFSIQDLDEIKDNVSQTTVEHCKIALKEIASV